MEAATASRPLVSCIVPVFDGEAYLAETIRSILAQTYARIETIVVDDGSTDRSGAIARGFGESVRVLSQNNSGQAAAANAGLAAATGEYVAFLDADDLWREEKLERQMALLAADETLGYCITWIQNFLSPDIVVAGGYEPPETDRVFVGHVGPTLLARREVFTRVGAFDTSLRHAHDTEWFARARSDGIRHGVVPEVLVERRIHLDNRSQRLGQRSRAEYLHLVKGLLDRRRAASEGSRG